MNHIKKANSLKFEKPIRKDSNDFNDSDLDFDSDFDFYEEANNNNSIQIDNGKLKDDINRLKQGLSPKKTKEKDKKKKNKNLNEKNKDNNLSNVENNELFNKKEESEEEDEFFEKDDNKLKKDGLNKNKYKSDNNIKNENNIGVSNDNNDNRQSILRKGESKEIDEIEKNEKIERDLINSIAKKEIVTRERIQLAESIHFKNEPDKVIITDEYGFIQKKSSNNTKNQEDEKQKKFQRRRSKSVKTLLQVNARIEKWNYMIKNYKEFSTNKKKKALLKSRTRKGIPDSLRGYVWQLFANKDKYYDKNLYQNLENEPIIEDLDIVIIKDLDRTFPLCQFFKEKYGNGQRKLYKVLSAYSKYNKSVGYVQGMGFMTAIFLIYMDEESSFYMLHCLMKKYKLEDLYYEGFPGLKKKSFVFLNLLKRYINSIYKIFQREEIIPTMYLSSWFISIFSKTLEFHVVLRIFDCFFLEGFKVIYRISLALLKLKESIFCKAKKGEVLPLLYKCTENIGVDELFKVAFDFNISRNYIDKCEEEFEKVKDDIKNEFMVQLCW